MDTPPHRLIYASVALTRRVTCVLHCTVQQHPSKRGFLRVSTMTLFFFNYWKPWMAKTWNDYKNLGPRINIQISIKGK